MKIRIIAVLATFLFAGCVSTRTPMYEGVLPPADQKVEMYVRPFGTDISRTGGPDINHLKVSWLFADQRGSFNVRADGSEKVPELVKVLYPRGVGLFQNVGAEGYISVGTEGEVFLTFEQPSGEPAVKAPTSL